MNNDSDWVDDVKRWYFSGGGPAAMKPRAANQGSYDTEATDFALGYEAAHPALVAGHWADPPSSGFDHSVD